MNKRNFLPIENTTIYLGALLILISCSFFLWTSKYTALIPLPLGLLFLLLGWLAVTKEASRKLVMHLAATLSILGAFPLFMGGPKLLRLLQGEMVERPLAAVEMSLVGGLCLIYLTLCIKYFISRQLEKRN